MNYDSSLLALYAHIGTSAATDPAATLLGTLYGNGTSGSKAASGQAPVAALLTAQRTEVSGVKLTAQQADVKTAMAAFTKAVGNAKTLSDALKNPAVLNVLLTANGMSDQIGSTALATKVLMSNLSDPASLANVLTDSRWKTLAQTYNFPANGLAALKNPATVAAITQGYAKITWEKAQDAATPGVSAALTFIEQAGTITSVDGILGNTTVRNVVTTAFDVPKQIAFQSLNAQEQAISTRLNVKDLQDPKFVQTLAERFMVMNNMSTGTPSSAAPTNITTLAAGVQGT